MPLSSSEPIAHVREPREEAMQRDALKQRIRDPVVLRKVADAGDDRAVREHDRQRERQAAQDEEKRQRDDERRQPRLHHEIAVQRAEQHRCGEREHDREPDRPVEIHRGIATIIPAKPIIEPIDRSNSPAIISRHAPTASMPEVGGDLRPVHDAVEVEHARAARAEAEHGEHQHRARDRGEFRPVQQMPEPRFAAHAFVGWLCLVFRVGGFRWLCVSRIVLAGYAHDRSFMLGFVFQVFNTV